MYYMRSVEHRLFSGTKARKYITNEATTCHFFCNRMFEILAEAFMMGMSQLHCNEHSSKKFVLVTSLACSYFYSSPGDS